MLDKAAEKGLYADLRVADMTQPLDLISDHYGAVISSGVFTTGHVGSEGVGQLLAVCETGGHLVITVKVGVWQDDIQPFLHALVRDGKVRIVDQTEPYLSMPGDPNTIPSLAIVIEKLSRPARNCAVAVVRRASLRYAYRPVEAVLNGSVG